MGTGTGWFIVVYPGGIMPIAVVYRTPAMTAEQYKSSWSGGKAPPVPIPTGLLFHAGVGEGDDFFTITVWDSRDAYAAFAPMFKRAMNERGLNIGEPRILPVHHTVTGNVRPESG